MTPARQRFIAKLNEEESYIRDYIKFYKVCIKNCKDYMCKDPTYRAKGRLQLNNVKIMMNALKKRIPQCVYLDNEKGHESWHCPTCRYRIFDFGSSLDAIRRYCPKCGQKLTELYLLNMDKEDNYKNEEHNYD